VACLDPEACTLSQLCDYLCGSVPTPCRLQPFADIDVDVDDSVQVANVTRLHGISSRSAVKAATRCSLDLPLVVCTQESEKPPAPALALKILRCPSSKPARLVTIAPICLFFLNNVLRLKVQTYTNSVACLY
jgi:hypothetical protein